MNRPEWIIMDDVMPDLSELQQAIEKEKLRAWFKQNTLPTIQMPYRSSQTLLDLIKPTDHSK